MVVVQSAASDWAAARLAAAIEHVAIALAEPEQPSCQRTSCCARARDRRDELAPHHSITSSASNCNAVGTAIPSVAAVPRLMTSSNLVVNHDTVAR